jgi:DNA-directed RNA polymerase specialized sigma24 family protein
LRENEHAIRNLARRKLGATTKRVFGSDDILNSVAARLLNLVDLGRFRPRNHGEAWQFIKVVVSNKTVDKNRLMSQLRHRQEDTGAAVEELVRQIDATGSDEEATILLHRALAKLVGGDERALFSLWLRGASHSVIAGVFGITETTSRRRVCDSLAKLRLTLVGVGDE